MFCFMWERSEQKFNQIACEVVEKSECYAANANNKACKCHADKQHQQNCYENNSAAGAFYCFFSLHLTFDTKTSHLIATQSDTNRKWNSFYGAQRVEQINVYLD